MNKNQQNVKEFMTLFNQKCPEKPIQLDEATAKLRAALILEECLETICKGLGLRVVATADGKSFLDVAKTNLDKLNILFYKEHEVDLVELADGLGDLDYVAASGTSVAAGINIQPVMEEIHASNMTKAWRKEDLEEAKRLYPTAKIEHYFDNLYRLVRDDGKIIKSPNYRPADVKSIIESQINS